MFLRAQRVLASERAPLAPAPLNLLGVPYFGFSLVRDLLQYCGCLSAGGSRKRSSFGDAGGSKGGKDGDVTNSKWWREWKRKQRNNASSDVYTFVARHDDMVVEGGRWRSRLAQHIQRHVAELENETYLMREQLGGKIESMADKLDALSRPQSQGDLDACRPPHRHLQRRRWWGYGTAQVLALVAAALVEEAALERARVARELPRDGVGRVQPLAWRLQLLGGRARVARVAALRAARQDGRPAAVARPREESLPYTRPRRQRRHRRRWPGAGRGLDGDVPRGKFPR